MTIHSSQQLYGRAESASASISSVAPEPSKAQRGELTYENLHDLIDRILIHELDKENNTHTIEIIYSFIGKVDSGDKPVESVSYFRQIGADVTSIAI